jgi:hypothetical protein
VTTLFESGGVAKLTDAFLIHSWDSGSNLFIDKIFSDSVCVKLEFKSVGG